MTTLDVFQESSSIPVRFGQDFMKDHARTIMGDSKIAIVEIVANSWDAGADRVEITWPREPRSHLVSIEDNGTGMTFDEFKSRWAVLSYNRVEHQGEAVRFPEGNQQGQRKAFGRNGKGRHAMFCFNVEYDVEIWRNGTAHVLKVTQDRKNRNDPFTIAPIDTYPKEGHGTRVSTLLMNLDKYLSVESLSTLIGSKFVVDPSFHIFVNGQRVELTDIEEKVSDRREVQTPFGVVPILLFDTQAHSRTSQQHGVAWWVNRRLVGEASWRGLDKVYLDARRSPAKQYTFVVKADILENEVLSDWSWFEKNEKTEHVTDAVYETIIYWLNELMGDTRKARKIEALEKNASELQKLPQAARERVGTFAEELQIHQPTIRQRDLNAAVGVLTKLEQAQTGYLLLEQLAQLRPDEIDKLSEILNSWSVREAKIVLDELQQRLMLIQQLEALVESDKADELHDIHPLFERGLWIFGPEYEGASFWSNKQLLTVLRQLVGDNSATIETPRRRPDLVALPNSSINVYSRDSYGDSGEVDGIDKVLIIELKRGGFQVTKKERHQAEDYADAIKGSGKVRDTTEIFCYVLGTTVAQDALAESRLSNNITVRTEAYSTILRRAKARTFHLLERIQQTRNDITYDPEVERVIENQSSVG